MIKIYPYRFKKLLLLLIPTFFLTETNAQDEYHPLLDTSAIWNFERVIECEYYTPYYHFNYSLLIEEDTIINDVEYHQLKRPAFEFSTPAWFDGVVEDCGPNPMETGYIGALRENIIERRVYFLAAGETEESLLYDFSLEVGDTLIGYISEFGFEPLIVSAVDSVLIGSNYRKRWIIPVDGSDIEYSIRYIESIGGLHGLVQPDPFFYLHSPVTDLICYSNGDGLIYPDGDESCMIITHSTNEFAAKQGIEVFPNPARGIFSVTLPTNLKTGTSHLRIIDVNGCVVKEQSLSHSQNSINTESWPAGMYLLQVISGQDEMLTRVVVE